MQDRGKFLRLLPPEPTPEDEICQHQGTPIKLMYALSYNPIHCMDCNLEIRLDTLPLSLESIELIARWRDVYSAIYLLWLDSEEYEEWAKEQLSTIASAVNVRGRGVQHVLNDVRRCYYAFFQDQSSETYSPLLFCPICGDALQEYTQGIFLQRVCERDRLVMSG